MSAHLRAVAGAPLALAVFALSLLSAAPAQAAVIYTYTGPLFTSISGLGVAPDPYTTADRVTGSFTMAAALGPNLGPWTPVTPLSFSFFDGVNTLTDLNTVSSSFKVTTDATGRLVGWSIEMSSPSQVLKVGRTIDTSYGLDENSVFQSLDRGADSGCVIRNGTCPVYLQVAFTNGTERTWDVEDTTPVVPEPTSMLLLGGAALAGFVARRRAR
ncbi:hypothetical protein TBR22_A51110 [Luteitalea sp. TBR-22]|uniref:PEP-CTERM sorting domain-containing protein n=1 Tax=Luteitalea sp. TBR-22 TaxID=2802971 RepID=UPI001AF13386|nr:PEP-CTERM sorting domain-containing protein [Luteitalea sp. TBR-22]BCS35876.1 hypothetical protein TBR22_A51110 [Luteitalea sp. TBR-22]